MEHAMKLPIATEISFVLVAVGLQRSDAPLTRSREPVYICGYVEYRPCLAVRPETRLRILQASSAIRRQRNASFLEGTTRRAPLRVHESARRGQGTEWHGHAPPLVTLLFLNAAFPNPRQPRPNTVPFKPVLHARF